jgi:hypothetical protein
VPAAVGISHPLSASWQTGGQLFLGFWIDSKIQVLTIYKSAINPKTNNSHEKPLDWLEFCHTPLLKLQKSYVI